jgi:heat shock protein HslJ
MTRILLAVAFLATACATADPPAPASGPPHERYEARGQEPGWYLLIHDGRIDYSGNYGEKKIEVARPEPRPSFNGRRYVTPRLTVDITYVRCNDAMSGFGFEHQVMVIADGETFKGCGGARKTEWDL